MGSDPLAGLNEAQREAAEAVTGPVRILAGAGTGKTRTITHRIANQVISGVARADQVLAVTFTDKAATELRQRLTSMGIPRVRAATFHAAAWAQLRYFLPRVADQAVPEVVESKVRILAGLAARGKAHPGDLAAEIEWAQARMLDPQGYAQQAVGRDAPLPAEHMAEVYAAYEEAKARRGLVDYADMLSRTLALLRDHPEAAAEVRQRYRFFTVDEYQDVNPAQHALLRAWLGDSDELCVVGDDDQTIYSFTGATADYLTTFTDEFPRARSVALTHNYRSQRPVLELANKVLPRKPAHLRKHLVTDFAGGPDPVVCSFDDDADEVAAVTARCQRLIAEGTVPGEIAVLYRTNAQSEAYEEALADAGVPYLVRGMQRFFDRAEVRQAMQVLRRASERQRQQEESVGTDEELRGQVESVLERELGHRPDREPSGARARDRWRNINALVEAAERRQGADPKLGLPGVVDALARQQDATVDAPDADGAVTLASLHRAKGLEFDAVFVVGCEEGLVPIVYATDEAELAEERRLLYVGMTRARVHLWLSWAAKRTTGSGRAQKRRPSRFLSGLHDTARPGGAAGQRTDPADGERKADSDGQRTRTDGAGTVAGSSAETGRPRLADLDPEQAVVAERLRAWRADRARRDEVPAFVICHDITLADLAVTRPTEHVELLRVRGLGTVKAGRYGDEILAVLRDG